MSKTLVAVRNQLRPRPTTANPTTVGRSSVRRTGVGRTRGELGAATAEYAVSVVAACGFGGILVALLKSDVMLNALKALINYALKLAGVEGVQL